MKPTRYHIIKSQEPTPGPRRAILFFSGWGFDAGRLDLEVPGYDTIFLWDYTENDAGAADIDALTAPYSEIIVIGWSFGVKGAAEYINNTTAPVTRTIAVNGTENHIDDQRGIPSAIFEGTLAGLNPLTLRKFQRRATGNAPLPPQLAKSLATTADNDQICRLRKELDAFGHLPHDITPRRWSVVVVSENDRIFPAENQLRAWQGQPDVRIVPAGNHFLPMADLRQYIVDKQLVSARFEKAARTYGTASQVQRQVSEQLIEMLSHTKIPAKPRVVEIGAGNAPLFSVSGTAAPYSTLEIWDIAAIDPQHFPADALLRKTDAEIEIINTPDSSIDLLVSASTIQWFNSPETFIARMSGKLAPRGVAALSFYQPGTLGEFSAITGVSLRYPQLDELAACARKCGLTVVTAQSQNIVKTFESATHAMRHMQLTGVNAVDSGLTAKAAALRYIRRYDSSPGCPATLTYRPAWLILARPDSQ